MPDQQRIIQQRGLYYDEIETGTTYRHAPGRTVTESDNVNFTTLTMNTQSLHLDAYWSAQQEFGQPLVNSMFTLSTIVGASVSQLTQGTIVANLGFEKVNFPQPLYHGDTLYTETQILAKRLSSSRPGQGIIKFQHIGRNQHGDIVAECIRSTILWESETKHQEATT
ncbi:MAG TPA: MaoC family dehydratase [Candidatus Yaniella excrementavium]|nr:MaoC family dehydratase [Candidatus Yaniella excrementavium]